MSSYYQGRKMPFSNPLANALVVLVGALAIGASIVLGFIAFVALGTLVLVLAAIIGIRVWWFNRKLARGGAHKPGTTADQGVKVKVIEGEFHVLRPDGSSRRPESDHES